MWRKRLGWCVWLIAVALLYFFENNTGTRILLISALLLPLFSILCAFHAAKRTTVTLAVPKTGKKDEAIEYSLSLQAPPTIWGAVALCRVEGENPLTGEQSACTVIIPDAGKQEKAFQFSSNHCGTVHLRMAEVMLQDWFGLWTSKPMPGPTEHITVLPELYPVRFMITEQTTVAVEGERWSMTRPGSDPSETFSIREYRPGDPIRQIHWKLSTKTDHLMLRELGLPVNEETLLLLETSFREMPDGDAMDAAVTALLSTSQALTAEDIPHQVCWKNRILGEPELREVRCQQDFDDLKLQVLTAACSVEQESVGTFYRKWYPETAFAHTAVFSPHTDTDAVSLWCGNRVTLVLPDGVGAWNAPGEIYITNLSVENHYLEL